MTKQEFILSQPLDMPAKDVLKAAKQAGLTFSLAYVHSTRSNAKKKGFATSALKPRANGKTARGAVDLRGEFTALVLRIGCDAAQAELEALKGRFANV